MYDEYISSIIFYYIYVQNLCYIRQFVPREIVNFRINDNRLVNSIFRLSIDFLNIKINFWLVSKIQVWNENLENEPRDRSLSNKNKSRANVEADLQSQFSDIFRRNG